VSVRRRASGRAHYNYFRDYDPAVGRYAESDPIGLKGGPNPYIYADDDPISGTDSKGLFLDEGGTFTGTRGVGLLGRVGYAGLAFAGGYGLGTVIYNSNGTWIQDQLGEAYDPNKDDSPEKQADRRAYHRRCDERNPPGLTGCDLIRWKIQKVKDCIRMRTDYMNRWNDTYKGHRDQIDQKKRELEALEKQLGAGCCGQ
jgi:RHS repeat-associated protein